MKSLKLFLAILALLLVAQPTCFAAFVGGPQNEVLAVVDKKSITIEDLNTRINSYPSEYRVMFNDPNNRVRLLEQLISEQLLIEYAKDSGYSKKEEFKKYIENAENQLLVALLIKDKIEKKVSDISDSEIKKYYDEHENEFNQVEERKVSQIVVKSEKEANAVVNSLKNGKSFEVLAKEKSIDPNAKRGGVIGWIAKNSHLLLPELESEVFSISKGEISKPIKTKFGYHILKVTNITIRKKINFAQAKDRIEKLLKVQQQKALLDELVESLKNKYKITRNIDKLK
ncbi:MAG: peptidyl-prolyl cis-trans isomerase [Candidatus Margulisiibacteriota bacterium]|jgi:peptidyl-prolyl cis-trans isomerase C